MGRTRTGSLLFSMILTVLTVSEAFAVSGGSPDSVNTYSFVVLISTEFNDGSKQDCSGSIIDTKSIITAAHCIMRPTGEVARSATVRDLRGIRGSLPIERALINRYYVDYSKKGIRFPELGDSDLAVLKTSKPIASIIPDVRVVEVPQTVRARLYDENGRNWSDSIDDQALRDSLHEERAIAQIGQAAHTYLWQPLHAYVIGFGAVTCRKGEFCKIFDTQRWWIEKQLFSLQNGKCLQELYLDRILQNGQGCFLDNETTTKSDTKFVYGRSEIRPAGLDFGAERGDSGGAIAVPIEYPNAWGTNPGRFIVIGVISSRVDNAMRFTSLLNQRNAKFLKDALLDDGGTSEEISFERGDNHVSADLGFPAIWKSSNGRILQFDRFSVYFRVRCTVNGFAYRASGKTLQIIEHSRKFDVCSQLIPDNDEAEQKKFGSWIRPGSIIEIVGDRMLIRNNSNMHGLLLTPVQIDQGLHVSLFSPIQVYQKWHESPKLIPAPLEEKAFAFVEDVFAAWNSDKEISEKILYLMYADKVKVSWDFMGGKLTNPSVAAKEAAALKISLSDGDLQYWIDVPYRSNASVTCEDDVCSINGIGYWHSRSSGFEANGSMSYAFKMDMKQTKIIEEDVRSTLIYKSPSAQVTSYDEKLGPWVKCTSTFGEQATEQNPALPPEQIATAVYEHCRSLLVEWAKEKKLNFETLELLTKTKFLKSMAVAVEQTRAINQSRK